MLNFGDFNITTILSRVLTLVIAFTIHELAHAVVADRFGDNTPRMNGRLTLNPLAHLDPIGTLMLIIARFGWAKPVPINPYVLRRHSPSAVMWVSLAGPASNLVLAILGGILWQLGVNNLLGSSNPVIAFLPNFLFEFMSINLVLFLFNLIPIPPLDGDKILEFFLPPAWARTMETIRPYGPMILLLVVLVLPTFGVNLLGWIMGPPLNAMMRILIGA
jgi:Zn-dependent protease